MRVLLDTHVWLWTVAHPERLVPRVERILKDPEGERWLSPISLWETTLLIEKGRYDVDGPPAEWISEAVARSRAREATLTHAVALVAGEVSLAHRDPVDRLLVGTALAYELTLVTADDRLIRARVCPTLSAR